MPDSFDKLKELDQAIVSAIGLSDDLKQDFLTYLLKIAYLHYCGIEADLKFPAGYSIQKNNLRSMSGEKPPATIGSWRWDVENDILSCDPEVAKIFNVEPCQADIGLPLSEYVKAVHPDFLPQLSTAIERTLQDGSAFNCVYPLIQKDGSEKWVFAIGRGVMGEHGRVSHFPGTIIDLTEDEVRKQRVMRFLATDETELTSF